MTMDRTNGGKVLRKDNGNFVHYVFFRRLGHCSVLEAELWSIFYGMQGYLMNFGTPTQYPDLIH